MHIYNIHKKVEECTKYPCEKCRAKAKKSEHHVMPQRWTFPFRIADKCIWLCRPCHDELEKILDKRERDRGGRLTKFEYAWEALDFITK